MLTLLVSVEVRPGDKLRWDAEQPRPIGYYQQLGVTAADETELETFLLEYLLEDLGGELICIDESRVPDFQGADAEVSERASDPTKRGIWYASGRAFYDDTEVAG